MGNQIAENAQAKFVRLIGRDGLEYLNVPTLQLARLELWAGSLKTVVLNNGLVRNILRCCSNLSLLKLYVGWYSVGGSFEPETLYSTICGSSIIVPKDKQPKTYLVNGFRSDRLLRNGGMRS